MEPMIQIDTRRRAPRRRAWPAEIWFMILSVAALCFVGGYFAGREHLKYEGRQALKGLVEDWQQAVDAYEAKAGTKMDKALRDYAKALDALDEN